MKLKDVDESLLTNNVAPRTPVFCLGVKLGRNSSLGKLVATDFTAVSSLISVDNPHSIEELMLGGNVVMEFDISTRVLEDIANDYHKHSGAHLFEMGNSNENGNTFYLLKEKFCLLDLWVHYSRKSLSKITALAKQSPVIHQEYPLRGDIEDVISGILSLPTPFLAAHIEALKRILPKRFEQELETALKDSKPSSNLEVQPRQVVVKTECKELNDTLFQNDSILSLTRSMNSNLNNIHIQSSVPYDDDTEISSSSKPIQSLKQEEIDISQPSQSLNISQPSQSLSQPTQDPHPIDISQLTQISQLTEPDQLFPLSESSKESDGSTIYSLRYLNEKFPVIEPHHFYKAKGYLVGCIPEEFELLCAKGYDYNRVKGDYTLTDPMMKPLELIITDINPKSEGEFILDETNSLTITLQDDGLLEFFKVRSIESLYINIARLSETFYDSNKVKLAQFTLFKKPVKWGSIPSYAWGASNLSIDNLI